MQAELAAAGRLALFGAASGLVIGLALARTIRGLLFNVSAADPLTLASTGALLGMLTIAASYGAARRATRIDPMTALRTD
jgi:ABC-type antimicrobial peptide transport system permease subunit